MTAQPIRSRIRNFKAKFFRNLRRTSPGLVLRLFAAIVIFMPWMLASLFSSWLKAVRWRRLATCRNFMSRHVLAFPGLDPQTLVIRPKSGGVSNANQVWTCRRTDGSEVKFFVKVFVSIGSFWAKHLSLVSPFPPIYGRKTHERFTVDMVSRVQLSDQGIPVPKLVAYDAVERVMVTEYLEGESVDDVLKRIAEEDCVADPDAEAVRQCAIGLAKVHNAGFSLIDTQPVNCIWAPRQAKVYFTDLEYCTREDKRIWDVGFFLCFLALRLSDAMKAKVGEIFVAAYGREGRLNLPGVDETRSKLAEYLPIFQTILDIRQYTPEELFMELLRP